jgi:translation initiation factor 5B
MIRTPILAFLGHVDAGKTTLQDFIRRTAVAKAEAGAITQRIGSSLVPSTTIQLLCGSLLTQLKITLEIPGLLLIDTPGHAAFVSLRKRGGTLADLAVLVVDIKEGLMPQTLEAIQILKKFRTPFIVAVNKLDTISGWRATPQSSLLKNIAGQTAEVQAQLDTFLYTLVGQFNEHGLNGDRYDRVDNYTAQLALVPCSAKTGEGIPELLVMASGLAQKFLAGKLTYSPEAPAKGTILEVKKEKGLGTTLDVIIYDGVLRKNDRIVAGTAGKPILSKVRTLLEPRALSEIGDAKTHFAQVDQVVAATGVKISAVGIDDAVAGMPLLSVKGDPEEALLSVRQEVDELAIPLDDQGVIAKADTIGSLEALASLLRANNIPVQAASMGEITRRDLADAAANLERDPLQAVILGFNVQKPADDTGEVHVFTDTIIYTVMDRYAEWKAAQKKKLEQEQAGKMAKPCKVQLLKGYVFRQSNPAIVGVEVLLGTLQAGAPLMKGVITLTSAKQLQLEKENVSEAVKGQQIALAMEGVTIGRNLNEGDVLYSFLTENEFRQLKELKEHLSADEKEALREIAVKMRQDNPLWGI